MLDFASHIVCVGGGGVKTQRAHDAVEGIEFLLNGSKTFEFREQNFKCLQRTREGLKYINTTLGNTKAHFRPHEKSNFMRVSCLEMML